MVSLFRNALAWEEYWRWDYDDTVVAIYYSVENKPLGYMVYLIRNDIMHIKEMIYLNREAQKGLWEYIHAHDSMIDEVRGNTYFNEPVAFDMDDGDIKETIRPYIMGRIVDIEKFFLIITVTLWKRMYVFLLKSLIMYWIGIIGHLTFYSTRGTVH